MDQLNKAFIIMGSGLVYVLICSGFAYLAWCIADWRTAQIDDLKEIDNGNMAVGVRRLGLLTMFGFGFSGALTGGGAGFGYDVLTLVVDGALIVVFAFACRYINDVVMMGHIDNDEHCKNGNLAVGLVESANYVATGLILWGVFAGDGMDLVRGSLGALIWFLIGQTTLLVIGWIIETYFTRFNIRSEIENGNIAAGVFLAGVLIPLGIIIRANILGPSLGLINDVILFLAYMLVSLVLLVLFSFVFDLILLTHATVRETVEDKRNVAGVTVGAAVNILVALVVAASL